MAKGVDLKTVMAVGVWTRPDTLLRHYAQLVPGKQRQALEGLFGGEGGGA